MISSVFDNRYLGAQEQEAARKAAAASEAMRLVEVYVRRDIDAWKHVFREMFNKDVPTVSFEVDYHHTIFGRDGYKWGQVYGHLRVTRPPRIEVGSLMQLTPRHGKDGDSIAIEDLYSTGVTRLLGPPFRVHWGYNTSDDNYSAAVFFAATDKTSR